MVYLFHDDAGKETLNLKGEEFKYLIKVRRHQIGDILAFRHPEDSQMLYSYRLVSSDGRFATCTLEDAKQSIVKPTASLHLGWCMIDPKSIEKALPALTELGVEQITFIRCDRSQHQFKPDIKRFERIVQSAMQQCGRSVPITFDEMKSLNHFLKAYPEAVVLDFCEQPLSADLKPSQMVIGPEGGLSDAERAVINTANRYRLNTPLILRSETAVIAAAVHCLL